MKAIMLAAGTGVRLQQQGADSQPKVLLQCIERAARDILPRLTFAVSDGPQVVRVKTELKVVQ